MEQIEIDPRTTMIASGVLLLLFVLSLLLPTPMVYLGAPVSIIITGLVVIQRYLSTITLETRIMRRISKLVFYGGLTAIVAAYALFMITGSSRGEELFALGIVLFCVYVMIPGLVEQLANKAES